MKPFGRQTPWELLGIAPEATVEEVRRAYERLSSQLAPGALALYSVADPSEQDALRQHLRAAYLTLLAGLGGSEEPASPPTDDLPPASVAPSPDGDRNPESSSERSPVIGPTTEFTGDLLRQLREARGLTLAEVAGRTRIRQALLEHLESESFAALPERVFVRGFVMAYAHELGLDPERVWASYGARWQAAHDGP